MGQKSKNYSLNEAKIIDILPFDNPELSILDETSEWFGILKNFRLRKMILNLRIIGKLIPSHNLSELEFITDIYQCEKRKI